MLYINVRPLFDPVFTGIPQLTWHVVRHWLEKPEREVRFFTGNLEVERSVVESLAIKRTGRYLWAIRDESYASMRPISDRDAKGSTALFLHSRDVREKLFGREIHVIHDLTGILTPEFHTQALVELEHRRFAADTRQAEEVICVSNASRDDVIRYLGTDPEHTWVAYPGVAWLNDHFNAYQRLTSSVFEPYALVLGTFEPRKNIELVFEYILANPRILDRFVFCFCGSTGWGGIYERCRSNPRITEFIASKRIRIIPFVDESLKYVLMKEASFLIYPSFIEGFGLPVAEALSVGVPVVTSFGGSLPEVAGDVGYYFDPHSLEGLGDAIHRVIADLAHRNAETRLAAYRQGARFTWSAFNEKVEQIINGDPVK